MTSDVVTLCSSRELLSFPPQQQDRRDASLFNLDTDINLLSYSSHQHLHPTHQYNNLSLQQCVPGHPLIIPQPETSIGSSAGCENNIESNNEGDLKNGNDIRSSSPDYDNLMPVVRLSQVVEEDGPKVEVNSINERCGNSEVNSPLDASGVGGVGTFKGGPFDDESRSPRASLDYKSGYEDSSNTGSGRDYTDGDLDVSCAGVFVASAADVNRIDMGNDLFSARATGVSDARAESHVSVSRKRVYGKFGSRRGVCSNPDSKTRVIDATYNILHECNQNEVSRVSLCVVIPESEHNKCEQRINTPDKAIAHEMSVFKMCPTVTKVQENNISSIPNGGKNGQNSSCTTSSGMNESSTSTTSFMSKTTRIVDGGSYPSSRSPSGPEATSHHPPSVSQISDQVSEHQLVTTASHFNRDPSNNSKPAMAATHIPLASVSTPPVSVIIIPTPSIPNDTSSTLPINASTSGITQQQNSQSARNAKNEGEADVREDGKLDVQAEVHSPDLRSANPNENAPHKSAPIGGVKVLPSTFIFNDRAFRETQNSQILTSPAPSTKISATFPTHGLPTHSETVNSVKNINSSYVTKNLEHISGSHLDTDVKTRNSSPTVNLTTEKTSNSSKWNNYENKQQSLVSAHNDITLDESTTLTKISFSPGMSVSENKQQSPTSNRENTTEKTSLMSSGNDSEVKHHSQISVNGNETLVESGTPTEKTLSSGRESSEIRQGSSANSRHNNTFYKPTDDDIWNDYAVPSDMSPRTPESGDQSPESQILSPDQNRNLGFVDSNTTSNKGTEQLINRNAAQLIPCSSAKTNPDIEDIYAIPIPKNQRHAFSMQSTEQDVSQTQVVSVQLPPKPPRLPAVSNAPSSLVNNDDDAFEDVVLRHTPQSTSQMKKSTTTGTLHSCSKDYSNIPNANSRKYDYFSLGRRAKCPRIRTLIDSQGIAVSLDMLLKSRRQSFMDDSNSTDVEQTLSVDDILRSCSEFEENYAFQKLTINAGSVHASATHPLTFSEVTITKALNSDTVWSEKQEAHFDQAKSRSIIKKAKNGSRINANRTSLKKNQVNIPPESDVKGKTNDGTRPEQVMTAFSKPIGLSETRTGSLEKKTRSLISTASGVSTKDYKEVTVLKDSRHQESEMKPETVSDLVSDVVSRNETTEQWTMKKKDSLSLTTSSITTKEAVNAENNKEVLEARNTQHQVVGQKQQATELKKKPDKVRSYYGPESETSKEHHVISNETGSNINPGSSKKWNYPPGYVKYYPDYDYPKDTIYPPMSPEEVPVSTKGSTQNHKEEQNVDSVSTITIDVQPLDRPISSSTDMATTAQQPLTPSSDKQKEDGTSASTTKVSNFDIKPDSAPISTVLFSTNSQESARSSDVQMPTSIHVVPLSTTSPPTVSHNVRNPSSSSSDITISQQSARIGSDSSGMTISQRSARIGSDSSGMTISQQSARIGSDSSGMTSPGVMSSLSVDISEGSLGDSPSPAQRSPNLGPKLEAVEALKWLRAAGFPQYAQMFEDGQFPVDMVVVERDHDFLDKDSLQSLFRRLDTLNKYAGIRLDALPSKKATSEEDDEDDFCALSERWEYQKSAQRWSRKDLTPPQKVAETERDNRELAARSGSHDSLLADQDSGSQTGDSPLLESKMPHQTGVQHQGRLEMASLSHGGHAVAEISPEDQKGSPISPRLRRGASDKIKTAKNLFKKMDGLKSTKSRRQPNSRNIVEISGPVLADRENVQIKLDRLNCVDISQPTETLPSPHLGHPKPSHFISRSSSSGAESQPTSPDINQPSSQPSPLPTSPRPHSDFMLRPKEVTYPAQSNVKTQSRSSHASPTQNSPSSHDSSFDEYYHAKTTFLQNLQYPQGIASEGVRKNNSDTNLVEIFLLPQDHQPGRFPRILQNGYIETEASGTAVNVRTGSVRLGRGTGLTLDNKSANSRQAQPFSAQGHGQRISVYDNFLPNESKKLEGSETRVTAGVIQLESSADSSFSRGGVGINKPGLIRELHSDSGQQDYTDTSRDSSVARTIDSLSDQEHTSSSQEKSVSFESSSSSSQTLRDSSLSNEGLITGDESTRSSRKSSPDSISSKSRVAHSSSVDSYFRDCSSNVEASNDDASGKAPSSTFQQDYDEFDRILQELYQNINDLTSFMDRDKNEKAPKLTRAATSPLPAGNKKLHSPLHVATPSSIRPLLKPQPGFDNSSPSLATSDLVPSPASPGSPLDISESLNFYRGVDLDNENSSSGGEGNTAESGSEEQEAVLTDVSHDDSLDQIIEVSRERRDSGVGHSLTRASSDRRHKKIRWHSFQKSHRPDVTSRAMQINSLTVSQLVRLQKLSLLRLTGIMEKCLPVNKSGWNWMVPRFMKRHKAPDLSEKNVFGVPLSVMAQRTGQPLPQCILYAMRYLRRTCQSAVGIFRKSGVKSKIQQLRDHLEAHPDTTNFDGENTYNVADTLKTYFRDLPECLLTNKMSETFRSIYTYVPQTQRLEAIQAAILLLPDENREVLQSILLFLSDISDHEADHQMNASNLAVCFTPTVFQLGPRQSVPYSPKRNRKNMSGVPDPREILEQKAAHECLLMMITDSKKLFTVPNNIFRQLQVQSLAHMEPTLPQDIGNSPSDIRAFGQERIQMVLKESHDKNRGWIPTITIGDVEVFHRKPMDDCPLKEWKLIVDIEAPPIEVLRRIMHERHTWDEDLLSWSVVERLDPYSDIFQFVLNSMAPHPPRNFCVLRYWRSDLNKGACSLITMSVEHSDALEIHGVWAIDLGTYFLMEPCGSGRSRLTYITRMDTRGRMPEWYTKIFGHISANFLERLKESFKQDASGPETKV